MLEFLPRDAMHSVVSVPLCGICLSVTFTYRIEMSNHILKLFSLPDRHAILVFFPYQTTTTIFGLGPPNGASNTRVMKNRDFQRISRE